MAVKYGSLPGPAEPLGDKRSKNHANLGEYAKRNGKSHWRKDLTRNQASRLLNRIDKIKSPEELFTEAIEAKCNVLAWQIRQDIEARAYGRPFTAINPAADARHNDADVTRIAVAIKNLQIINQPELPAVKNKQQALAAITIDAKLPDTVEAEPLPDESS